MKPGEPLWKVCYPAILTINWRNKATLHTYILILQACFLLGPWFFFRVPIGVSPWFTMTGRTGPHNRKTRVVPGGPSCHHRWRRTWKRSTHPTGSVETSQTAWSWNQAKLPEFPHPKITCLWIWINSRSRYGCTKYIWLHISSAFLAFSLQNLDPFPQNFWSSQWKNSGAAPIFGRNGAQHAVEPRLFHPNVLLALSHWSWMSVVAYGTLVRCPKW